MKKKLESDFDGCLEFGRGGVTLLVVFLVEGGSWEKIKRLIPKLLPLDGLLGGVGGVVEPNDVFLNRKMLFNPLLCRAR